MGDREVPYWNRETLVEKISFWLSFIGVLFDPLLQIFPRQSIYSMARQDLLKVQQYLQMMLSVPSTFGSSAPLMFERSIQRWICE